MAMSDERDDCRDEALSRAYRRSAEMEPPPALDALILAAARREAEVRPVRAAPWWRRWAAPVGVFATLVLTVSLTLLFQREQPDLLPAAAPTAGPAPQGEPPKAPAEQAKMLVRPAPAPAPESRAKFKEAPPMQAPAALAPAPTLREEALPAQGAAEPRRDGAVAGKLDKAEKAKKAIKTPEQWLEDIRRLRREGREPEAQAQLAAFRQAYPDYRLPEDMKAP
jgi:hypothetical protein